MLETNLMFFQQDLIDYPVCVEIQKSIKTIYNTSVYLCEHPFELREQYSRSLNKKFGFVLKSLK